MKKRVRSGLNNLTGEGDCVFVLVCVLARVCACVRVCAVYHVHGLSSNPPRLGRHADCWNGSERTEKLIGDIIVIDFSGSKKRLPSRCVTRQ